jgi:XisH protein
MAAQDRILAAVKAALVKDGWTITADPFTIKYEDATLLADLGAEAAVAAERANRRIVIEVKSFLGPSPFHDFEQAIGQYIVYRTLLEETTPDRELFLAIGDEVFKSFFERKSVQLIIARNRIRLLVVKLDVEEVESWTS